jgi:hypothetical protein
VAERARRVQEAGANARRRVGQGTVEVQEEETSRREGEKRTRTVGLAVDQRRRARDALARRALNVVVLVLMACVIVAAKPLSSNRGTIR